MVILNKIYTRTGDQGSTALGNGRRVAKTNLRIEAYGTVDETNAAIGLARANLQSLSTLKEANQPEESSQAKAHTSDTDIRSIDKMLLRVQNDLFDLGADLCVPDEINANKAQAQPNDSAKIEALRVTGEQVEWLERQIDMMNETMTALRSFVLPAGTSGAAGLHLARTICRRAERNMVALAAMPDELVSENALKYTNRLSDFLFVAARYANARGQADVLWVPGQNRSSPDC